MAFIGFKLSHETARLLNELDVPGQRQALDSFHITVVYLGENVPIETLAKAMIATYEVTQRTPPFTVRTNTLTCFPKNEDGVPIICRVKSDALHAFQAKIKDSFTEHGVPFSNKYPDYNPHVTLAYSDAPIPEQSLPTVEWGAHEVVLWGGDEGDGRVVITFPFSLEAQQRITQRVAQRFISGGPPLGEAR